MCVYIFGKIELVNKTIFQKCRYRRYIVAVCAGQGSYSKAQQEALYAVSNDENDIIVIDACPADGGDAVRIVSGVPTDWVSFTSVANACVPYNIVSVLQ